MGTIKDPLIEEDEINRNEDEIASRMSGRSKSSETSESHSKDIDKTYGTN
jgi:hypothetical protein